MKSKLSILRVFLPAISIVIAGATWVGPAEANDRALAETLFMDAKRLMVAGKFSEACPKLAESQRLEPAPGTVLNLAVCHESEGKLASAWVEFKQAAAMAKQEKRPDRQKLAEKHLTSIEPKLSRLTISVPADARVSELEVRLDQELVGEAAWNNPAPIDPGQHSIRVSAVHKIAWESNIQVGALSDNQTVRVPRLLDEQPAVAANAPVAPRVSSPHISSSAVTEAPAPRSGLDTQQIVSIAVGGVGLVAVGVGSAFALSAKSQYRGAECDSSNACTGNGLAARGKASDKAAVATAAFAGGAAALVGAALLWFTAPGTPRSSETAALSTRPRFSFGYSPAVHEAPQSIFVSGNW